MSWFDKYRTNPQPSAATREARRLQLEEERLLRKQKREQYQQQLNAAAKAQEEANQALEDLLNIAPDLFEGDEIDKEVSLDILDESDSMTDFDTENGVDGDKAMEKLGAVKCEFDKSDIENWFSELEGQLEVIEVKAQWTKRTALQRFLPVEIKTEAKSLFKLSKTQAGADIYKKIKTELIDLFGQKPEEAYTRAKNRVMTGKPSQLGKAIIEDICTCVPKLKSPCCARIVWGMFREALPREVRNHIAEYSFAQETYKQVFAKADQVFDSNNSAQPIRNSVVASVSPTPSNPTPEVAAAKPARGGRGGRGGFRGGFRGGRGGSANPPAPNTNSNSESPPVTRGPRHATAKGDSEKLCKIHYKWGENGNFCAAPWKCPMKNVYKSTQ